MIKKFFKFSLRTNILLVMIFLAVIAFGFLFMNRFDELKSSISRGILDLNNYCTNDIQNDFYRLQISGENYFNYEDLNGLFTNNSEMYKKKLKRRLSLLFEESGHFVERIELLNNGNKVIIKSNNGTLDFSDPFLDKNIFLPDSNKIVSFKISASTNENILIINFIYNLRRLAEFNSKKYFSPSMTWFHYFTKSENVLLFKQNYSTDKINSEIVKNSSSSGFFESEIIDSSGIVNVFVVFNNFKISDEDVHLVFLYSSDLMLSNLYSYNTKVFVTLLFLGLALAYLFFKHLKIVKEKNTQLEENEQTFRGIFESFVDLYFRTDLKGNITMVSPSVFELAGYTQEEIMGKNVSILYVDLKERKQMLGIIYSIGYINDFEISLYNKQGEIIPVSITSKFVYDNNNKPIAIEGTLRDISERKKVDEQILDAKVKAESAVRAKNEFLTNLSHELKTPLNAVIGYSEHYKDDEELNSKYRKIFNIIENSGKYLLTLINDLLDISKNDAGKIVIEKSSFDMNELLEGVYNIIKYKTDQKNIDFILNFETDIPQFLYSDPKRIRQILINLLGNATKFTLSGYVKLNLRYKDKILLISVEDTGIGITEENLSKIFVPFYKINSEKYEGNGLGLAITKMLVDAMEGDIEVNSVFEQGTIFKIQLPIEASLELSESEAENRINKIYELNDSTINDTSESSVEKYSLPEREELLELKELVISRNISAVNNFLDRQLETGNLEFSEFIRKEVNKFNIEYIDKYLSKLLEQIDER